MGAVLTYQLRRGVLTAVASGKHFQLATHQDDVGVSAWEKAQELKAGRSTLVDHRFELPQQRPAAGNVIPDSVRAGTISHKLEVASGNELEIYDYPGAFAQRIEGLSDDNPKRTVPRPWKPRPRHTHRGPAVFVEENTGGFYIHGWPPCNLKRCVVVIQRWDDLLQALTKEKSLSFYVEY